VDRGPRSIMRELMARDASVWDIAGSYPDMLSRLVSDLNEMARRGLAVRAGKGFSLTSDGLAEATRQGLVPRRPVTCPACSGRGLVGSHFQEVLDEFRSIAANRPRPVPEFDQGYVDEENALARCLLLYERGDLEGSSVFLLGDDDLTGICLALTGLPRAVTVVEIDERLIDFIGGVAAQRGLPIEVSLYDARRALPPHMTSSHHVFITDPVETLPGIALFLSRCAQALEGPGTAGYFGLTHLEASRVKWAAIQRMLLEMNLVITDALPFFNRYFLEDDEYFTGLLTRGIGKGQGRPGKPWYNSTLFRVEAYGPPVPLHMGDSDMGEELYMDDDLRQFGSMDPALPGNGDGKA